MRIVLRPTAVAVLFVAGACSEGATGPNPAALSREEAVQLAARIAATSSDVLGSASVSRAPAFSLADTEPSGFSRRIRLQAPCTLGGTVDFDATFSFSVDTAAGSGSLETEATMIHRDCGLRLEEGSITLNGDPDLTASAEYAWTGGEQTQPLRVTQAGRVAWARDTGETGACAVNLVAVTDFVARRRTVEGTFCGIRIDDEITWTVGARG